jgi:hypothetical protein
MAAEIILRLACDNQLLPWLLRSLLPVYDLVENKNFLRRDLLHTSCHHLHC